MKKIYCLLLSVLCLTSAYSQQYRYVNADQLNLRAEPNTASAVQLILYHTAEVELVEEYNDDWAKVKAYGYEGYVSSLYLVYDIGTRKGEPYYSLPTYEQTAQLTTESYKRSTTSTAAKTVSVYICDSKSAYAYHSSTSCRGLNRCTHGVYRVAKNEAINEYGRRACQICY